MGISTRILKKYKMAYGTEVEVSYTCRHCREKVTDTICFSNEDIRECISEVYDQECPECGECNDLDVNL